MDVATNKVYTTYKAHGLRPQTVSLFRREIYKHYKRSGRDLPWRRSPTPYHVLVSEVMLQQTQVDRVIPKYREWLRAFPTIRRLARAPLRSVVAAWSGLGYNRRARFLWLAAHTVVKKYHGKLPRNVAELETLPGIGPATARSIAAFGYNQPTVFIETNIRSVYLHHFFPRSRDVADSRLLPLIEQTLDWQQPRRWYSALMDYGSDLKRTTANPSRRSKHHVRQSRFEGSDRQIRGAVLKRLITGSATRNQLRTLADTPKRADRVLDQLVNEKLLTRRGQRYRIGTT